MAKRLPKRIADQIASVAKIGTSNKDCMTWVNTYGRGVEHPVTLAQVNDVYRWCIKKAYAQRFQILP